MSERTLDIYDNIFIENGSRPYKATDNDRTVDCFRNQFQSACSMKVNIKLYYYKTEQVYCTDFYNKSDSQLLWWQEIQRTAIFIPRSFVFFKANANGDCPLMNYVNFYISETTFDHMINVDVSRGYLLTDFSDFGLIYVCYKSIASTRNEIDNTLYTLMQCLSQYGDGLYDLQ